MMTVVCECGQDTWRVVVDFGGGFLPERFKVFCAGCGRLMVCPSRSTRVDLVLPPDPEESPQG